MKHKSSTELQARALRARLGDLFELEVQARSSLVCEPGSQKLRLEARLCKLPSFTLEENSENFDFYD